MRYRSEAYLFALACIAMVSGYFWVALPATPQYGLRQPSQQHFNQLLAGFRSGQLSLERTPDPELAKLADPYDPAQNAKYRLQDASYYKGRFYIYYGVAPILVLFWPYAVLTGHYLAQKYAVAIFCSLGFLVCSLIIWQMRKRFFPKAGSGVTLAMVVAVGTVNGAAFILRRPEMYEVAESCAYAMTIVALAALGCAISNTRRPLAWTALSSILFALAVASRPTFLTGAASILIPVSYLLLSRKDSTERKKYLPKLALAAFLPLVCTGIALAAYNYLRFGDPLEFGIKYLMMSKEVTHFFAFDWSVIWLNVKFYLFLPTRLSSYFPFVRGVEVPPFPPAYGFIENPFGIIPNIPFLLFACAAPLAWLRLDPAERRRLRLFVLALAWVALSSFAVLVIYIVGCIRYEFDFTPYLAVLAVIGVFGIEEHFSSRIVLRNWIRLGWALALVVSVAFNFFGSCEHLAVLRKDAPLEYGALTRIFDYPTYAVNRLFSRAPEPTAPSGDGPIELTLRAAPRAPMIREPLVVMGSARESAVVAFIKSAGDNRIVVGFEFPGTQIYESQPIQVDPAAPIKVTVFSPQLLPPLGNLRWKSVSYEKQLSILGVFSISVNGKLTLAFNAPIEWPTDKQEALVTGIDPIGFSGVAGRFSGPSIEGSRLPIGNSLNAVGEDSE